MNVAIYSNDMTEKNCHLMPWRTVLEVTSGLREFGHHPSIFSGINGNQFKEWTESGVRIREVKKPRNRLARAALQSVCLEEGCEVLYWPLDWRRVPMEVLELEKTGLKIIWYMPGAHYGLKQVLKAACFMKTREILPYLIQVLASKRHFARTLSSLGARPLITMTPYTRDRIIEAGYPPEKVISIPPGKDPVDLPQHEQCQSRQWQHRLGDEPYFLYFGPAQAIRGVNQILSAFGRIARKHSTVQLVCLFRSDPGLSVTKWKQRIARMESSDRIHCFWKSVGPDDLSAFIGNCRAVLLPFLIVPSEIPMAAIEAAGHGKPVIGTGPDGTGDFIDRFGLTVPSAHSYLLSEAMLRLVNDGDLYVQKCKEALSVYENHPTWKDVARQWLEVAG